MSNPGFWYRRLTSFFPCVLPHVGKGNLSLRNKFEIASLRDVFLSANYWRLFGYLKTSPKLVVDLGGHCGHFTVLLHLAVLEKFGADSAEYILVEPLPQLVRSIRRTMSEVRLSNQARVVQGLVGMKGGQANLTVSSSNLLTAAIESVSEKTGKKNLVINYIDLDSVLPANKPIDILKIDIEGSEYLFVENYPHLIERAQLILIELHRTVVEQKLLVDKFGLMGLRAISPIVSHGTQMALFVR